jgi:Restriction endonuclease S subunits
MTFKDAILRTFPKNWKVDTLGNSLYIKARIGWKGLKKNEYLKKSNFRIINGSSIVDNKIIWDRCGYISKERYNESPEIMLRNNDIVMTKDGTLGKLAIIQKLEMKTSVASGLFVIRVVTNEIEVKYLYYYFTSKFFKNLIMSRTEGSVIPHLYQRDLVNLRVPLPRITEQKSIAHIFSTLDEKIDVNNRINKNLESMALAIFKHWFVDFEFPDENGKPYKSSGGEMVECELGMIPKGWDVVSAQSLISVKDGTHDSPKPQSIGYPLITSKHLKNTRIDFESANKIKESDYIEINKRSKVERYDILISMIGTVGNLFLVQDKDVQFAIKNVGLFKTSERIDLFEYIYCYFKTPWFNQYISERSAGSTQQYISLGELRKIPIINPDKTILKQFKKLINPMFSQININSVETNKLNSARNFLLPKLMSGEIRVPTEQKIR